MYIIDYSYLIWTKSTSLSFSYHRLPYSSTLQIMMSWKKYYMSMISDNVHKRSGNKQVT